MTPFVPTHGGQTRFVFVLPQEREAEEARAQAEEEAAKLAREEQVIQHTFLPPMSFLPCLSRDVCRLAWLSGEKNARRCSCVCG